MEEDKCLLTPTFTSGGSGGCPFGFGAKEINDNNSDLNYSSYLKVDKLLSCQEPIECGTYAHDQHLFIITHQVFELWFKQVIIEIDSVRELFMSQYLDECKMLIINNRLQRVVLIFKTMVDQFIILETMTALDFMDFRVQLQKASGFQSLQFRLLEIKLGIPDENRVRYNKQNYQQVFDKEDSDRVKLHKALNEPSLLELLEKWLTRTPGLHDKSFNFWESYAEGVRQYLNAFFKKPAEAEDNTQMRLLKEADYQKQLESFHTILDPNKYAYFVAQGERNLSHEAFKGALMISLYRDVPRFSPAFQMLNLLMDIDSLLIKWRHNHLLMVQRMIGSKIGTGGSSGYQYLRSTVSDRYKPFLDLFNLSTYLIPREYIPRLSTSLQRRLSIINLGSTGDHEEEDEIAYTT